jgi:HEPN domain-containing protein
MRVETLFDEEEFSRWMKQAEHTLESAGRDAIVGDYAWACFKARQAAEFAIKALLRWLGLPAIGHSILGLLGKAKGEGLPITEELKSCARTLDRHYVPPSYPNAFPTGSPFEFYDHEMAEEALACAQAVMEAIDTLKEGARGGKERQRQREGLLKVTRAYAKRLRDRIGDLTAIVCGSVARGDFNLGSDVDILIISEGLPSDPLRRMDMLYSCLEPPLEPKGYTPVEFRTLLAKRHPAIVEALEKGIVVADDLKFITSLFAEVTNRAGNY